MPKSKNPKSTTALDQDMVSLDDSTESDEIDSDNDEERTQTVNDELLRSEVAELLKNPYFRETVEDLLDRAMSEDDEEPYGDEDDELEDVDSDLEDAEDIDDAEDGEMDGVDGGQPADIMNPPTSPSHPEAVGAGVKKPRKRAQEQEPALTRGASVVEVKSPVQATNVFIPIIRIDSDKREIEGVLSNEDVDTFKTIFDYPSMKRAVQEKWHGNIREQHDPRKAVGRGVQAIFDDDTKTTSIRARISRGAESTWQKILDGTLSGFSIGAANAKSETRMVNGQPILTYKDFDLAEVSVVDAPSNPGAARSGLTIYRAAGSTTAEMYASELDNEDELPVVPIQSIPMSDPSTHSSPVRSPSSSIPVQVRSVDDRVLTDRAAIAMTETPLSAEEIASIAGVDEATIMRDNAPGHTPPASQAAVDAAAPLPNVSDTAPKTAADYNSIDASMNNEAGNDVAHVHMHAHSSGDAHMNSHGHRHAHGHRAMGGDDDVHSHPHMHTHASDGDGSQPHVHLHEHGHEYRSSAPDVNNHGVPRFNAFIGENDQVAVRAKCAELGIAYPGKVEEPVETRMSTATGADTGFSYEKGQIAQAVFDGQKVVQNCPSCKYDARATGLGGFQVGQHCIMCGYVILPGDTIPSTVEEMNAVPRSQVPEPETVRGGMRISGDTRAALHDAILKMAQTCGGTDGNDCPHCKAILMVLDPDMDGDDDQDESLDSDNDMGDRVQKAQLSRAIESIIVQKFDEHVQPVISRLQSVSARLATTQQSPDLTRMTNQLSDLYALVKTIDDGLSAVSGTVEQMAASERPGGPVVRAVDKQLTGGQPRSPFAGVDEFTPNQIAWLRQQNLMATPSAGSQVSLAEQIFKQQQRS